jgi:hypothetical protein
MKQKALFSLLILFYFQSFAQFNIPKDEKYTPPKNSIFNKINTPVKNKTDKYDQVNNAIKISLLELIRGEGRITYERKIINQISAEIGLGGQFVNDFVNTTLSGMWYGLWSDPNPDYTEVSDSRVALKTLFNNADLSSGSVISFALRYYFTKHQSNLSYADITYKNVYQNFEIFSGYFNQKKFSYINQLFLFNLGNTWVKNSAQSKLIYNFGIGLGFKLGKWEEFLKTESTHLIYYKTGNYKKNIIPVLSMKFNVGFYW